MLRAAEIAANGRTVITNDLGDFAVLSREELALLCCAPSELPDSLRMDLEARSLLPESVPTSLGLMAARTRKAFLREGPSLHIFVVTLRCDHACQYCQVSRAPVDAIGYDMSAETALEAVSRVFESDARCLTIEFQGGEPAIRFDLVRLIVGAAEQRNSEERRMLSFSMATTLHLLSQSDLEFCRDHKIALSTSIDGPAGLHATQRPKKGVDTFAATIAALERARAILGAEGVSALPTLTRASLLKIEEVIDLYVELGFRSVFLRPLQRLGFALKTEKVLGFEIETFLVAYARGVRHILALNRKGVEIEEATAAIALRHIMTPFHSGYMDMRSPAGAGLGVLVYNYDGQVYPTDEARMAAESGDDRFALGKVSRPLDELLDSPAMRWLATGAVAEAASGCTECAFVPFCGADPVYHAIGQGDPAAHRPGTDFCAKQTGLFRLLFGILSGGDAEDIRTLTAWALRRPRSETSASAWREC